MPCCAGTWRNGPGSRMSGGVRSRSLSRRRSGRAPPAPAADGRATSCMNVDRTFVDTNVFVYAVDRHAARKRARAQTLLLTLGSSIVLSTQVLQEFFVTVTRKLPVPLSSEDAEQRV